MATKDENYMKHIERLIYNLKWRRIVWRYKGIEYTFNYSGRRAWMQFNVWRYGRAYGRFMLTSYPICEACDTTDGGEGCQECCEHEFDSSEGYTCINCGADADMGSLIDAAEYSMVDR